MGTQEIGSVGVDSGGIAFVKEKDLKHWVREKDAKGILGVSFWGGAIEEIKEYFIRENISFRENKDRMIFVEEKRKVKVEEIIQKVKELTPKHANRIVRDCSYDRYFQSIHGNEFCISDKAEMSAYFVTPGDAGYPVWKRGNKYYCFLANVRGIRNIPKRTLVEFHVPRKESFVLVDPCYVEEGEYGFEGTTIQLPKGDYVISEMLHNGDVCGIAVEPKE